ncbi:hypothetical protein [Leifsonia xyli]|uniref:hypothetical protein n=1 Tax=Leifsonia xyli TaxID=1575 RepID=UPI003D67589A
MLRLTTAGIALGLLIAAGASLPALASNPEPTPTSTALPGTPPSWYSTAPGPTYTSGAFPVAYVGKAISDGITVVHVDYWGTEGEGPRGGQSDITVNVASQNSDKIMASLANTEFATQVTQFTDMTLLPNQDAASLPVSVDPSGALTFTRPPIPKNCIKNQDPQAYDFMGAALGRNGLKYSVEFKVTFNERPDAAYQQCTAALTTAADPQPTEGALSLDTNQVQQQAQGYGSNGQRFADAGQPGYNYGPAITFLVVVAALVALGVFLYKRFGAVLRERLVSANAGLSAPDLDSPTRSAPRPWVHRSAAAAAMTTRTDSMTKASLSIAAVAIAALVLTGCSTTAKATEASSEHSITPKTTVVAPPTPTPTPTSRWSAPVAPKRKDYIGQQSIQIDRQGHVLQRADLPNQPAFIDRNGSITVIFQLIGGEVSRDITEAYISADPNGADKGPSIKCDPTPYAPPQLFNCSAAFVDTRYDTGIYYGVFISQPGKEADASYGTLKTVLTFYTRLAPAD